MLGAPCSPRTGVQMSLFFEDNVKGGEITVGLEAFLGQADFKDVLFFFGYQSPWDFCFPPFSPIYFFKEVDTLVNREAGSLGKNVSGLQ